MRLPEPFTFFVDRSLGGRVVADALADAGHAIERHDDHFNQAADDTDWIAECGVRRWVILTKDGRIRSNRLEQQALLSSSTAAFILGRADLRGTQMAESFKVAMPRIQRALRRFDVALIASVSVPGGVTIQWAGGVQLPKPKSLK